MLLEPLAGPTPMDNTHQLTATGNPTAWDYLESSISLIFPLSHPSNTGKWTTPVSYFVNALILAYTRRVARERMSSEVVRDCVGRKWDENSLKSSYRLGRAEDEKFVDLFMPLLLQGMYAKNQTACTAYESSIKRLCSLLPEMTVEPILEQLVSALDAVTSSHQLQVALRLLSQLTPVILQRAPGILPQFLTSTLPAIDGADPFKTVQALTFYSVLFSHLGSRDLSAVEVDDLPLEQIAQVRQLES